MIGAVAKMNKMMAPGAVKKGFHFNPPQIQPGCHSVRILASVSVRMGIRKLLVSISNQQEHTKSMEIFLYLLLGSILVTSVAHCHGSHNHAPAEQIMMLVRNDDGVELNLYRDKSCGWRKNGAHT